MKNKIYLFIACLIIGELVMFYDNILIGLGIHIANLLSIIFITIIGNLSKKEKNILQSLSLLIILRMINISIPQFFKNDLLQYILIYGIMLIPIYSIKKNQNISNKELGINFFRIYIYIPIAIMIGIMIGFSENRIINPLPLINKTTFSYFSIFIVMFIFIGAIEELIFRSVLQTRFERIFGLRFGLLLTGIIFGIMHTSYGIFNEILFASIFGIILGYIFQKTRNFFFITSIHVTANIIMFGIMPNKMSIIANMQNLSLYINDQAGIYVSLFLVTILSISFLISETKYYNKYNSNLLYTYSSPLLLTFIGIIIYKVVYVIKG